MDFTSPIKRFAGTITLPDALTFEQYAAWERAISDARQTGGSYTVQAISILPAICMIVETWSLDNLPEHPTPETFPATPVRQVSDLLVWLVDCVGKIIDQEDDVPNG